MVSNASDDLPDPLTPVMTMSWPTGSEMLTFFRLCVRAPRTTMAERSKGADGMDVRSAARFGLVVSAPNNRC